MKARIAAVVTAALALTLGAGTVTAAGARTAAAAELPGMCSGRSDPGLIVTAHANGQPGSVPRYLLDVATDPTGAPRGSLILGRGADQILVTDFCRVWQHPPGQQPGGDCETIYPEGATTAHAVGLTKLDGQQILVRTDVRKLASGEMSFRLRYRPWNGGEVATAADTECDDAGWTWIPSEEGWYPLDQMSVRTTANGR